MVQVVSFKQGAPVSSVGSEPVTQASHAHAGLRRPAPTGPAEKPETNFDEMLEAALPERSPPERAAPERSAPERPAPERAGAEQTEQPPASSAEGASEPVADRAAVEQPAAEHSVAPASEEPTTGASETEPVAVAALVPGAILIVPAAIVPAAAAPELAPAAVVSLIPGAEASSDPAVLPVAAPVATGAPGAAAAPHPAVAAAAAESVSPPAVDGVEPGASAAVSADPADGKTPVPARPDDPEIPIPAGQKTTVATDAQSARRAAPDLPAARDSATTGQAQPPKDQAPAQPDPAPAAAPEPTDKPMDAHPDAETNPVMKEATAAPERHGDALLARAKPQTALADAPLNSAAAGATAPSTQETPQPLGLTSAAVATVTSGTQGVTAPAANPNLSTVYAPAVALSGLAVEILARAREGKNRFEIRLDPPELGRIDVHLRMDRDGNVTSRLYVERSETLDLLRRDAPQLERALNQAGLKTSDQGMEFTLRDQGFGREPGARNEPRPSRLIVADEAQPVAAPAGSFYARRLGLGNGLDIRV
jgi:flagellar hook-length control protein FliK